VVSSSNSQEACVWKVEESQSKEFPQENLPRLQLTMRVEERSTGSRPLVPARWMNPRARIPRYRAASNWGYLYIVNRRSRQGRPFPVHLA